MGPSGETWNVHTLLNARLNCAVGMDGRPGTRSQRLLALRFSGVDCCHAYYKDIFQLPQA